MLPADMHGSRYIICARDAENLGSRSSDLNYVGVGYEQAAYLDEAVRARNLVYLSVVPWRDDLVIKTV